MRTGEFTTTSYLTAQSDTPSATAILSSTAVIYENSDVGDLRYGFADGAVVSLSSETYGGPTTATIDNIASGVVTFTTSVSVDATTIITKTYTGPHKTQANANRLRVLGHR